MTTTNFDIEPSRAVTFEVVADLRYIKGDKGDSGTTPSIGPNGNWFLGTVDTGKPARGPAGAKGEKGDPGAKGDIGPQGTAGPKGDTGAKGDKGATGATGATGLQGPKGDKGDPGAKGDIGPQGPAGPKGDTGAKGPQGPQGPQGPKGDKGDPGAKGDTGPQGPAGLKGDKGDPGAEVFYIDLAGSYPNYTCPVAMDDITTAYEAGKVLECRCAMGPYTATLPLFIPMSNADTWIFSGSGALTAMNFPAQSLTIAIVNGTVQASNTQLATKVDIPTALPNPAALTINSGSDSVTYDGSGAKSIDIPAGAKGDKGDPGAKGEKGDTGAIGPQGPQGAKGDKGDKGPQGAQGAKGDKGETGDPGPRGPAGKTPVKGTDYYTEGDKQEIVDAVLAALPNGNGVSY